MGERPEAFWEGDKGKTGYKTELSPWVTCMAWQSPVNTSDSGTHTRLKTEPTKNNNNDKTTIVKMDDIFYVY